MNATAKLKAALTVAPQDSDALVATAGMTQHAIVEALGELEIAGDVIVEAVDGERDAAGGQLVRAHLATPAGVSAHRSLVLSTAHERVSDGSYRDLGSLCVNDLEDACEQLRRFADAHAPAPCTA